jgi:hypothetical protein
MLLFNLAFGQWSITEMQEPRIQIGGAAWENKAYIVGGLDGIFEYTDKILVFDATEQSWSEIFLSEGRAKIACAASHGKLYCGGGILFEGPDNYDLVDIIDLGTHEVATAALSQRRTEIAAAAVGDKVLFAGGLEIIELFPSPFDPVIMNAYSVVDIYDISTQTWTTANLSEARGGMAYAVAGNKAFFAGGYNGAGEVSDAVDIYDAETDTWTTETLSQARAFFGNGTANGSKVFFAGGVLVGDASSDVVDIYDLETETWSAETLSQARLGIQAASVGDHVIFSGGGNGVLEGWRYLSGYDIVDIYNVNAGTWTTHTMALERFNHVCLSVGNHVLIAGGFGSPAADLFTIEPVSVSKAIQPNPVLEAFPNPVGDELTIRFETSPPPGSRLFLTDVAGKPVSLLQNPAQVARQDMGGLPAGMYFLNFQDNRGRQVLKVIKQ